MDTSVTNFIKWFPHETTKQMSLPVHNITFWHFWIWTLSYFAQYFVCEPYYNEILRQLKGPNVVTNFQVKRNQELLKYPNKADDAGQSHSRPCDKHLSYKIWIHLGPLMTTTSLASYRARFRPAYCKCLRPHPCFVSKPSWNYTATRCRHVNVGWLYTEMRAPML